MIPLERIFGGLVPLRNFARAFESFQHLLSDLSSSSFRLLRVSRQFFLRMRRSVCKNTCGECEEQPHRFARTLSARNQQQDPSTIGVSQVLTRCSVLRRLFRFPWLRRGGRFHPPSCA